MKTITSVLKNLTRRGQHNIQKVVCLALGLAVSAVLITELNYEQTFDTWFPAWDRTYILQERVVRSDQKSPSDYWQTSGAIAPGMKRYAPIVEVATRTTNMATKTQCHLDAEHSIVADVIAADTSFFEMFPRSILSGNAHEVLGKPHCCMVSSSVARMMGSDVMGKKFTMADFGDIPFEVGGVFEDFPWGSSLHGTQIVMSMASLNESSTDNWLGNDRYVSYIRLKPGHKAEEMAPYIDKMLEENVDMDAVRSAGVSYTYVPILLSERYTHDSYVRMMSWILGLMAFVLLCIAVVNYLLITIGNLVGRSTEMAVRKCFGAGRASIGAITFSESLVHVLLAVVLAALLLFSCRGTIETYLSAPLSALVCNRGSWVLVAICLLIVLLGGVVPAWLYGRMPVAVVFRGYKRGKRRWKLVMLSVQFCIVSLFASLLYCVQAQYGLMVSLHPGYDAEDVAILSVQGTSGNDRKHILQELSRMPQVQSVSSGSTIPLEQYGVSGDNVLLPGEDRELFNATDMYEVTDDYLDVMGIRLSQGTFFTERNDSCRQILVSESFAQRVSQAAGWKDGALGKRVRVTGHSDEAYRDGVTIVGIFPDIKVGAFTAGESAQKDRPQFYTYYTQPCEYMLIRMHHLTDEDMAQVLRRVQEMFPRAEIQLRSWAAEQRNQYREQLSFRNAIGLCVAVTLSIALFGLFGYSADEVNRRSKEMAVRKVNGAGMGDVIRLFLNDIMRVAVPSVLLGDVLSWLIARQWLTSFSQKASLSPWLYLLTSAAVLLVVGLSVAYNSYRVAKDNPVKYLKDE